MSINNDYVPKTETELESWMKDNCYNFNSYSINGHPISEGFGIDKSGELFIWYYTERGTNENLNYFRFESEIVEFAFNKIKTDKWARAHCIGFTTSKEKKREIEDILKERGLNYFQDEIPYYGPQRPVYRTFVLGCDINKVKHLKVKYFEETI